MINKQLNNKGLSETEMNMRTYIVQEYLRTQGKLVTPFTLLKLNEIYESSKVFANHCIGFRFVGM